MGSHSDFGTIFYKQAIIKGLPRATLCVNFSFTTGIWSNNSNYYYCRYLSVCPALRFGPWCPQLALLLHRLQAESESVSCSVVSDSLWPYGLYPASLLCPWGSPGKNTGVGLSCPPPGGSSWLRLSNFDLPMLITCIIGGHMSGLWLRPSTPPW